MTELTFWCDRHRDTPVDVFVTEPFDFDEEYGRALVKPLGSVAVRFVSIPSLIRMKEIAGRAQARGRWEGQTLRRCRDEDRYPFPDGISGAANAPRRKDSKANGQRARQARHDARGMTPFGDVDDVFEMKR
jgi:hypothetical protein